MRCRFLRISTKSVNLGLVLSSVGRGGKTGIGSTILFPHLPLELLDRSCCCRTLLVWDLICHHLLICENRDWTNHFIPTLIIGSLAW
ncbi:Uncharacterized protein APZ42_005040 [Daphnia magna]|uniref:Uncharacterized protein n=1 Tax=Daphnia magna TaxID=35525 RepID=A0A164GPM0_9CRUS|nr:Uncharacterized protein APZ42_005040 [Daphnia magna]